MTFNLARAVGPALAALSVKHLGIPASFAINSASYLLLVVGVLVVRTAPRRRASRAETRLRESLRLVRDAAAPARLPPDRRGRRLRERPGQHRGAGVRPRLRQAGHLGRRDHRRVRRRRRRRGVPARRARGRLAPADARRRSRCSAAASSPSRSRRGSGSRSSSSRSAGFGYLASNTSATSRLQLEVAEHQRGRIMALWSVAFLGLRPLASLADGGIAGAFGVRAAGVVLAVPVLLAALVLLVADAAAATWLSTAAHGSLTKPVTASRMELHFIADDLEDHVWYLDLVADFVDDVQRFAALAASPTSARAPTPTTGPRPAPTPCRGSGSRSAATNVSLIVRGETQRIRFHIDPGLVVRARRARAAERLLADDGAGRLVVDVEVAGGVAEPLVREVDRARGRARTPRRSARTVRRRRSGRACRRSASRRRRTPSRPGRRAPPSSCGSPGRSSRSPSARRTSRRSRRSPPPTSTLALPFAAFASSIAAFCVLNEPRVDDGAHEVAEVGDVADLERAHLLDELLAHLGPEVRRREDARRGGALLPLVLERAAHDRRRDARPSRRRGGRR